MEDLLAVTLSILKLLRLSEPPRSVYRFNITFTKISRAFFFSVEKSMLSFTESPRSISNQINLEKEVQRRKT